MTESRGSGDGTDPASFHSLPSRSPHLGKLGCLCSWGTIGALPLKILVPLKSGERRLSKLSTSVTHCIINSQCPALQPLEQWWQDRAGSTCWDQRPVHPLPTGLYVLVGAGALMMTVGFFGCCGAMRESQCVLGSVSGRQGGEGKELICREPHV